MKQWIKKQGMRQIEISFDGKSYIFSDTFAGLFAIASRDEHSNQFYLYVGNSHYTPEEDAKDAKLVMRHIRKYEKDATFTIIPRDVDLKYYATIKINEL